MINRIGARHRNPRRSRSMLMVCAHNLHLLSVIMIWHSLSALTVYAHGLRLWSGTYDLTLTITSYIVTTYTNLLVYDLRNKSSHVLIFVLFAPASLSHLLLSSVLECYCSPITHPNLFSTPEHGHLKNNVSLQLRKRLKGFFNFACVIELQLLFSPIHHYREATSMLWLKWKPKFLINT